MLTKTVQSSMLVVRKTNKIFVVHSESVSQKKPYFGGNLVKVFWFTLQIL